MTLDTFEDGENHLLHVSPAYTHTYTLMCFCVDNKILPTILPGSHSTSISYSSPPLHKLPVAYQLQNLYQEFAKSLSLHISTQVDFVTEKGQNKKLVS